MVSIHSMTHISFIQYYKLDLCSIQTLRGLAPTRYKYPAKTIGYSQLFYKLIHVSNSLLIISYGVLDGLRGNAPIISLGGNSITMNGH